MASNAQSPQDYFRMILLTVVGQAYTAAGYELEDLPIKWAGGRFRFIKPLEDDDLFGIIEYQLLAYSDTEWSSGMPSRFKVTLIRADNDTGLKSSHKKYVMRDLSALVVEDFGIDILPSAKHWWTFRTQDELGKALAEAGHLTIGYGMPWLAGELAPDDKKGDGQ
ncbi:MAG: hypothetical protein RLP44_30815 [Aggregatilineales bacterium]